MERVRSPIKAALDFARKAPTKENLLRYAQLWEGHEDVTFWWKEWVSLSAVECAMSLLQAREVGDGFPREGKRSEEMPRGVVLKFDQGEGLFYGDGGDLKDKGLRCIAAKMNEYRPTIRYEVEGDRLREVRDPSPFFSLWEDLYRAVTGELCVRQCRVCGLWEVRGEGFQRASWMQHPPCGNRAHVREFRRREAERGSAEEA